jgi:UDP-glucose 4-epimerase
MTWLVTGGAGYIGAHVVRALLGAGLRAVVLDDLSSGHKRFVPHGASFVQASILDGARIMDTIDEHEVTGVIHVAGFKYAGVSVQRPLYTYEQNVTGTAILLAAMNERNVDRIVFSSSAAVYGTPDVDIVTEDTAKNPQSPYGESKLIGEWLLRDQAVAVGLRHTSLRYFNVVGSGHPSIYDTSPHNLFPLVFDALVNGRTPRINGNDYPTPDGTNVRDYIHVADLAVSHVAAARRLDAGEPLEPASHLGSGACHRHRFHAGNRAAARGRPGQDRRGGGPRRTGPGLEDASFAQRNGRERVGGATGCRALTANSPTA